MHNVVSSLPAQAQPGGDAGRGSARRGRTATIISTVLALVAGLLPMFAFAPSAQAAVGEVSYVDAASTAGNRTSHVVRIPTTVQAGDALVLYLTTNSSTTAVNDTVSGWTLLQSREGNGIRGRLWTKTAVAADAGANVTVTTAAALKSVVGVAAYRSTGAATVSASAGAGSDASGTSVTAPAVAVAAANSWLVSIFTEKSSVDLTWAMPNGATARTTALGTGSGKVSGVLADSAAAVATGTAAARSATTSAATSRSVAFSVVIAAGDLPTPVNNKPVARFSSDCSGLVCEFHAGDSSDADGDALTYSWNFGDGGNGTGKDAEHTYASDGQRTVTLTVSDGKDTDSVSHPVDPKAAVAQGTLAYVGGASTAGNKTGHSVTVPTTVKPNDRLLLFFTGNSTSGTITDAPSGWSLLQSRDGNTIRGRAWTKLATGGDAGSEVSIATSVQTKGTLSVVAYRSSGVPQVSASAVSGNDSSSSSLATPTAPVAKAASWVVNYWGEKSSSTLSFTLPDGTTSRTTAAGTGSGKTSGVVGDTNGEVAIGTAAARTATTSVATSRSVMFTVVVDPGTDATNTNEAPTAEFTSGCATMTCEFDGTRSFDPDDDTLTYNWNFGDGQTGTGSNPSHTYAATGTRTVTLTVSDGSKTDTFSAPVTLTALNPAPGHNTIVPDIPRTNLPLISSGEIWDIEVVGNRVYVAGGFTSLRNQTTTNTSTVNQAYLAAYDLSTGLIDTNFRPTFSNGTVDAVEASPDGTKLFVSGNFNAVNGVTERGIARLNPATGAPIADFTASADGKVAELAVTNTTVYVGGRFSTINGLPRSALAAVDASTGAVRSDFVNNITGGIGANGELTVQRLKLTRDEGRLLVVHTGRQVNGQNRYGVAIINTRTGKLTPWRTRLWEDNLQYVGGIQRAYGGDIAPNGEWFAVTSGSGGDRPPINDMVIAFNMEGGDNMEPLWNSRHFDSVYSVAISEKAVYVGGHFAWNESPTSPQPWPGLDDVGYGTGQGLSGYGLGDAVVRRDHLGALNPVDGTALEWNPGSNSYEGNKYLELTPRGLFSGGDAVTQGEYNVGRVAFFDFNSIAASNGVETAITAPIEGRVVPTDTDFQVTGTASAASGVRAVRVEVMDRGTRRYLNDDLTTWGTTTSNTIDATLATPNGTSTNWSLPLKFATNRELKILARTVAVNNAQDPTKATKRIETFGLTDQPPSTSISAPSTANPVTTTTFTIVGSATDDKGVNSIGMTLRNENNQYLQDDGTVSSIGNTFRITPDVVGATSTTWQYEVTVPTEGSWRAQARASDTAGQTSLDTADRTWLVSSTGAAPTVSISSPVAMVPPTAAQTLVVEPGGRLTFAGSAADDGNLTTVEISLRNATTRENLAADGTWGSDVIAGWYRVSPPNINSGSYNWSWQTPFNLKAGTYSFAVRASDNLGLTTSTTNQGRLTINAQVAGDAPPDGRLNVTGTVTGGQQLRLDLAGTATDDKGVAGVKVALLDGDTARYLQPNGTMAAAFATLDATLASPNATSTTWTLGTNLPTQGDWNVTAYAVDNAGQQDTSTTGATARYRIYPGDNPPVLTEALLSPTEGTVFPDGKIFVSGRAEDDQAMQSVSVAVINSAGQYLSSTGTFTSTTASWRTAFLNSPGTPGSNFSYTTPVIPPGAYRVQIRAIDQHDQITTVPPERNVTVTHPAGNLPPVADFTVSCQQNVCTYDARTSTDENASTLTYTWDFGNGTGSGPLPTRTYTAARDYTVVLTAKDEWGITATATKVVTIVEPTNNVAPNPVINAPACNKLVCNISGVGSADPNTGDTFTYLWNFGDGTATSTASAMSHTFPAAGTYTVTLTTTDGWGKAKSVTRDITVSAT